ncbi:hypothetical protein HDU76_003916 [Blyttiomyces sp. JEL0837]|nr:hypothetical protein HDU76_003916 [Blyttiomyces sp. JEL0837]
MLLFRQNLLRYNMEPLEADIEPHSVSKLVKGGVFESVKLLHNGIKGSNPIVGLMPHLFDSIWTSMIFIWWTIEPERSGLPNASTLHHTDKSMMESIQTLESARNLLNFLGVEKSIIPCWWAMHLADAGLDVMKGNSKRAASKLAKRLNLKWCGEKRLEEITDMTLMLAVYCAVISRYSGREGVKQAYKEKATTLFQQMEAVLFLKWLDS